MEVQHRRTDVRFAPEEQPGGLGNWKDLNIGKMQNKENDWIRQ